MMKLGLVAVVWALTLCYLTSWHTTSARPGKYTVQCDEDVRAVCKRAPKGFKFDNGCRKCLCYRGKGICRRKPCKRYFPSIKHAYLYQKKVCRLLYVKNTLRLFKALSLRHKIKKYRRFLPLFKRFLKMKHIKRPFPGKFGPGPGPIGKRFGGRRHINILKLRIHKKRSKRFRGRGPKRSKHRRTSKSFKGRKQKGRKRHLLGPKGPRGLFRRRRGPLRNYGPKRLLRGPKGPFGSRRPKGPLMGPGGPLGPRGPKRPLGPMGPKGPLGPMGPKRPNQPMPWGPLESLGPGFEWLQGPSFKGSRRRHKPLIRRRKPKKQKKTILLRIKKSSRKSSDSSDSTTADSSEDNNTTEDSDETEAIRKKALEKTYTFENSDLDSGPTIRSQPMLY